MKTFPAIQGVQTEGVEHRCGHILPVLVWQDEGRKKNQLAKLAGAWCEDCARSPAPVMGPAEKAADRTEKK